MNLPEGRVSAGVILLAAGQGKRMRSELPKVLHEIGGQPLLFHTLDRVAEAAPGSPVAIIVGHARERVESAVRECGRYASLQLSFVHQAEQLGTGHAVRCAMEAAWGQEQAAARRPVLVLPGDLPLLPASLISQMLAPLGRSDALRMLSCELPDPTGYGRVVRRGKKGAVLRIVEERDANLREKAIREVVASIYLYQPAFLKSTLGRITNRNAQKEYYLTDLVAMAARSGKKVDVLRWEEPDDLRGVNDPWELAQAGQTLNDRCVRRWAVAGARFVDPRSARVEVAVELAPDVTIHPGAILAGRTRVGRGATIGPRAVLTDVEVDEGANVKAGTVAQESRIGAGAQVGPYAHLRPGSVVGAGAKVGNFVELKKATVGEGSSVAHLSYLGDAEVGRRVNIGCGFVTCNFDGRIIEGQRKHRTVIEDDAFIGSDCQAVAPVRIGRGAYVASGSTITEDVEPEALAIARARQVNKPNYAKKLREG
jgi:bifunctional UDP-N-acetylglucosamine pyrophosphorylase / glucosamine-1-phosphate N-acetyltransferase